METIEHTVAELGRVRRLSWTVSTLHVCLYATALLIYFLGGPWPLALALLTGNVAFYLLGVRRVMGHYRREAAAASLRFGLGSRLQNISLHGRDGINRESYAAWAMTPTLEGERSLMCRHFFSGTEGTLSLSGCELTLHYEVPGSKRDYRFLSGTLLTAGQPEDDGWLLLRSGLVEESALAAFLAEQDYHPCQPAPAEGYLLYARSGVAPLSPELSRQISSTLKKVPSLSLLRLTGTGAAVFLNGRFYTGSRYPTARLTAERLQTNTLPERDELWKLFRLWTKAAT